MGLLQVHGNAFSSMCRTTYVVVAQLINDSLFMKIIHFIPLNDVEANGILPAALGLAEAQHRSGLAEVLVVDVREFERFSSSGSYSVEIVRLQDFELRRRVADIAVFHGVYHFPCVQIAHELRACGIPYLVVPHSSLTHRGQRVRWWKKIFGNFLWFRPFCRRASAVQFLTVGEQEDSVAWCSSSFVLPNGVNLVPEVKEARGGGKCLRFLYVGRYDVNQKGLDVLVEAMKLISTESKLKSEFFFYGTNYRGGRDFLDEAVADLASSGVSVSVNDPVYGGDKEHVYMAGDVFLLTSRFEGHPIGLLEAMSAGLPVLITQHTNVASEVERADAGWIADLDPKEIAHRIDEIVSLSFEEVARFGHNATDLATRSYSWKAIVPDSISKYRYIIEQA